MPTKNISQILVLSTTILLIISLILGLNWLLSIAMIVALYLYYFSPSAKNFIISSIKDLLINKVWLTISQYHLLTDKLSYIFQHYVLVLWSVYLLLAAYDYMFSNLLFLPLGLVFWLLIIALLVSYPALLSGKIYLWSKLLDKSDFFVVLSIVWAITMLIYNHTLPYYTNYFFALWWSWILRIVLQLIFGKQKLSTIYHQDLFWIWWAIALICMFIYLRNIFPQIQESITIEKIMYQTWYIYLDCPK